MRAIYFEKNIPKILLTKALKPVWPGVVYSAISPTRVVDVPEPPLPGPRWVRVKNRLCGICASDLHLLFVEADPKIGPAALPGTQRIYLGHETLSVVTEVGPGVTGLKVGDRVIMDTRFQGANCHSMEIEPVCRHCAAGNHSLCENSSLGKGIRGEGGGWGDGFTAHETELYRVPDELDDETAMLAEPLAVGVRTALRRLPGPDETALILGSGIIGQTVIGAVRALSPECRIVALARYDHQAEMAQRMGADDVIIGEDAYAATARLTGAKLYHAPLNKGMLLGGFDVVYDCVGNASTVEDSLRLARAGGAVVLAGVHLAPMHVDLTPVWYQEVELVGLYAHGRERWQGIEQSTYDLTMDLLLEGRLQTDGLITHRFPLSAWKEAIATSLDKRSGAIKVILDYR